MEKMNTLPNSPEISPEIKKRSLELYAQSLRLFPDDRFPSERLSQSTDLDITSRGELIIPTGPWETDIPRPDIADLTNANPNATMYYTDIDQSGRPVHPWYKAMLQNPNIGIISGKGKSYYYGPNFTTDPVIVRYDHQEPEILFIVRKKSYALALPGGFVDPGEDAATAAIRECFEETGIQLIPQGMVVTESFHGPVFDARVTVNAWPITTSFRIDLDNAFAATLPSGEFNPGNNEVEKAIWIPVSKIPRGLFGSHELLIQLALEKN